MTNLITPTRIQSPRLDEGARRRPEFTEGVPIRLSDGQEWTFPRPTFGDTTFRRDATGKTVISSGFNFGAEYERLLDAYESAPDGTRMIVALIDLAYDLIRRNYDLTFDDCRELFRLPLLSDPRRAEAEAMFDAIADLAVGNSPKVLAVGSGPASPPTE